MERWGTVTHSIIATDQRTLILHMAKRRHLVEAVKVAQAQLFLTRRKKTPSSAQPPRRGSTAAAKPKARAGSPPVVSVGVPRPVSGGDGSPSSGTARDVLGLATTMGAKTVDLATTVGGAAAAATANMMSQADSLKEAAKARVQEALLNSAVEKVDRARAALKSFDEEAQRLMREERPCAGVAFVSYETCLGHGASHAQLPIAHLSLLLYRYETCEMADDAIEAINDLHGHHIVQDLIEGRDPNGSRMSDRRSAASPDHDDSPEAPRSQRASSRDSRLLSSKTGEDVQRHSRRSSGRRRRRSGITTTAASTCGTGRTSPSDRPRSRCHHSSVTASAAPERAPSPRRKSSGRTPAPGGPTSPSTTSARSTRPSRRTCSGRICT